MHEPAPTPSPGAPAPSPSRHAGAMVRLARAPAVFALAATALTWASTRLPAVPAVAVWGGIAGGWAGLWLSRRLPGPVDLRWLLPIAGIAAGATAGGIAAPFALAAAATLLVTALLARQLPARVLGSHDPDEPAAAGTVLGLLALLAPAVAWALHALLPAQAPPLPLGWAPVAAAAVAAFAGASAFAMPREHDPFDEDHGRRGLVLAGSLVLVAGALGFWAPRLIPLSVALLLAFAAAGRPRTVGVLALVLAPTVLAVAELRPQWLAAAFGGWSATAVLALVAAALAIAYVASLLVFQRDRIRARLRAASGHLITLAEKSPGLVATLDRDLRHRAGNLAYQAWSSRSAAQLAGLPLEEVLGAAAVARLDTSLRRALAGASQQMQVEAGDRVLELRLEPCFGLDGAIDGVHLLGEDVTWRGQQERDVRSLVAAAPEPTLVLDEAGAIQLHNDAALALFAARSDELVGTPLTAWLSEPPPGQGERAAGMLARRRDGARFPVELRLGAMPGGHGGRSVVSLRDLSSQHALEEDARSAREQAQATLDSICDALVVCDQKGVITAFNPAATELTGWSREDAVGRVVEDVVSLIEPTKGQARPSVLRVVLATGRPARLEGERELVRRDGSHTPIEESASPLRDRHGRQVGGVLLFHDVTHIREQAQALSHMAQHDFLTGLPNRVLFQDRLTQALARVPRGDKGAVLYMDLDKFKPINDTLGHPVGDKVLQEVAQRLRACVREDDTVSRQGGDEFVLLLVRLADPRDAARVAEKLIRSIEEPILVDGHELRVGASVGISLFPQDGSDARTLMKQADTALYHVKETGRGRYSYFTDVIGADAEARMRMEHDLRLALAHEDFVLDYQPVVTVPGGRLDSVEALLRWRQGETLLLPEAFLPVAEETGLIVDIDAWVLREACWQNAEWQRAGLLHSPVSVNVSLARFDPDRLLAQVGEALSAAGLDACWLEIEFRGEQLFPQGERGRELVSALRAMGIRVAVDDAGSGQASVAQLADYGFDALKLDRAFVEDLPDGARARRVAEATCLMGRALGYPVVAKGVASDAHARLLAGWGCAAFQGEYVSAPVGPDAIAALLDPTRPAPAPRRLEGVAG